MVVPPGSDEELEGEDGEELEALVSERAAISAHEAMFSTTALDAARRVQFQIGRYL